MPVLGFDTETYLITASDKAPKPVVCSWANSGGGWLTLPNDERTLRILSDPSNAYVGHNIAYDIGVMMRWVPATIPLWVQALEQGRVFDTQLRQQLKHLEEVGERDYPMFISLADLQKMYHGLDRSADKSEDSWRLRYGTLDGIPLDQWPAEAAKYAIDDAVGVLQVFESQGGVQTHYPTEALQVRAALALHLASVWGFATNQANVQEMDRWLNEEISKADARLDTVKINVEGIPTGLTGKGSQKAMAILVSNTWADYHLEIAHAVAQGFGVGINEDLIRDQLDTQRDLGLLLEAGYRQGENFGPGSIYANIKPWCWNAQGEWNPKPYLNELRKRIKPIPRSTKGPRVGETDIAEIIDRNSTLRVRADREHWNKMWQTYVRPYLGKDTIHAAFSPMVGTGRTGCRSPNLQNIPERPKGGDTREKFRKNLRARPGYKLGTVDQSALELVTLAATIKYRQGMSAMGDAINAGQDLHCLMASQMTGRKYDDYIKGRADGKDKPIKEEPFKTERQAAKAFSFGKPGGLGKPAMQAYMKATFGVEKTIDEIAKMDSAYKAQWPEVIRYLRDNGDICDNSDGRLGVAFNNSGRKKANCRYTQMNNYPFQSLAADGMKDCLWELTKCQLLGWFWTYASDLWNEVSYLLGDDVHWQVRFRDCPLRDSHIVNFVHDEIVDEHPDHLAEEAFALQKQIMVDVMARWTLGVQPSVEGDLDVEWQH